MSVFLRGRIYWYTFMWRGEEIRESTKQTNKNAAIRAERQRKTELQNGYNRVDESPTTKTFADVVREFVATQGEWSERTRIINRSAMKHLLPAFGKKFLDEISVKLIKKYRVKRQGEETDKGGLTSNRTINIEIGLIRQVLRSHKMWARLADDLKMLPENTDTGIAISKDDEKKLLSATKQSKSHGLYTAVLVSLHTGLRCEELRMLHWRQVDLLDKPGIIVGKSKTKKGEGRWVPLSPLALETLRQWRSKFPHALPAHFVFPSERYTLIGVKGKQGGTMQPYKTFPDRPVRSWKMAWSSAKAASGVDCRWHDLRHTCLTRMAESGAGDSVLQAIAGWMSPKMKERYCHIGEQAKMAAIQTAFNQSPHTVQ